MIDSPPDPAAGIPLLETKLHLPGWRSSLLSRPRLIVRLRRGVEGRLTLVSAPPGFGKTTLLAEWLAAAKANGRPAGWVSLDRGDDDPALFWTYVITALQRARPGVGAHALARLRSPQPPSIDEVLTTLLNEIDAVEDDITLVLDDFHVVEAEPIHAALTFLLDHLSPRLHLVIASRTDPPFPLARLRALGQLTELRAADLRFTPDEAAAFLKQVMGLSLSPVDVAVLEERSEGWIAGLQLAALSLRGREDVHGFLAAFSGDNRYIADYLVEEVLHRQPAAVRRFLLQTSILERLSGPLCDAVTGGEGGSTLLETLERGNLFVVPLDDRRRWYRYHHLFADVLQAQAREEEPDRVCTLHRRASTWYERNGSPSDAVRHALAAGDQERAAGLIEMAWPDLERSGHFATWLGWVRELPDAMVRARPVLSMGFAWALLNAGELEAGEARLRDVERWLDGAADPSGEPATPPAMVVVDEAQFRSLPVALATARTYLAQSLGDVAGTVAHARRLLELVPESDHLARGPGAALLGLAFWASGELEMAVRTFSASMAGLQRAGDSLSAIGGSFVLGDMQMARGRLRVAAATYENALARAAKQPRPVFPGVEELRTGLGELHRERGDLEAAERNLRSAAQVREEAELPGNPCRWYAARARVRGARGDLDGALALLEEAERLHLRSPIPDVRPVAAMKARILIAQGSLAGAEAWAEGSSGLSAEDAPSYMREFEHLTLARVLLARHAADRDDRSLHRAIGLLNRLLPAAEEGGRTGSVIEILMLQALVHQAGADTPRALVALEQALALATPEGYLRIFVDEGEPLRRLLRHAAARGIAGEYVRRLLAAFDAPVQPVPSARPAATALVQPLTPREVEILRLIAAGMRNREIAKHLFISSSTVKRHVANTYSKLGVGHRTAAVARANELKLL